MLNTRLKLGINDMFSKPLKNFNIALLLFFNSFHSTLYLRMNFNDKVKHCFPFFFFKKNMTLNGIRPQVSNKSNLNFYQSEIQLKNLIQIVIQKHYSMIILSRI